MNEELFREDATLRECRARITAITDTGVLLDRTVFYPQGGGQAGDAGVLVLADGRELAVTDTRKGAAPGEIVHLLERDAALNIGDEVIARIDWQRRDAHMRFHTTTHLLCALVPQAGGRLLDHGRGTRGSTST